MRFPWYWFRSENGPKKAAFLLDDNSVVEFNYDYEGQEIARGVEWNRVIAILDAIPANGDKWSSEWKADIVYQCGECSHVFEANNAESCPVCGSNQLKLDNVGRVGRTHNDSQGYPTIQECVDATVADRAAFVAERLNVLSDPHLLLEEELNGKDWYSHYSDDHRYWAAGEASDRRIKELIPKCDPDKVRELWAKYAPEGFNAPV